MARVSRRASYIDLLVGKTRFLCNLSSKSLKKSLLVTGQEEYRSTSVEKWSHHRWRTQDFFWGGQIQFSSFWGGQEPILKNFNMESYGTSENLGRDHGPLSPPRTLVVTTRFRSECNK